MCRYWRMTPDQVDALDNNTYGAFREYMELERIAQSATEGTVTDGQRHRGPVDSAQVPR